jgi:hypothetical protein
MTADRFVCHVMYAPHSSFVIVTKPLLFNCRGFCKKIGVVAKLFLNTELTRPKSPASVGGGCQRAVKSSVDSTMHSAGVESPTECSLVQCKPMQNKLCGKVPFAQCFYHLCEHAYCRRKFHL